MILSELRWGESSKYFISLGIWVLLKKKKKKKKTWALKEKKKSLITKYLHKSCVNTNICVFSLDD